MENREAKVAIDISAHSTAVTSSALPAFDEVGVEGTPGIALLQEKLGIRFTTNPFISIFSHISGKIIDNELEKIR